MYFFLGLQKTAMNIAAVSVAVFFDDTTIFRRVRKFS